MSSKQKGKGKKASKGGGTKKGGGDGDGGGRELFCPDVKDGFVEVIFVDYLVRFFKTLDSANDRIPTTFLTDTVEECYQKWHSYFPGLVRDHLVARAIPSIPLGCSYNDWGGKILVELKDEEVAEKSLINQLAKVKFEVVDANARLMEISNMVDQKVSVASRVTMEALKSSNEALGSALKSSNEALESADAQIRELVHLQELKQGVFDETLVEFKIQMDKQQEDLVVVHEELKKQVLLTNQVKQRTILEKARIKILQSLDKPTLESEKKWKDYFLSFELEEWKAIFGDEKDVQKMEGVKRLLGSGSIQSNKKIHELEFEELYESVFAMEVAKDQESWVWLLAYISSKHEEDIKAQFSGNI